MGSSVTTRTCFSVSKPARRQTLWKKRDKARYDPKRTDALLKLYRRIKTFFMILSPASPAHF